MRLLSTKLVASIFIVAVASAARAEDVGGPLNIAPSAQSHAAAKHSQRKAKSAAPAKQSNSARASDVPSAPVAGQAPPASAPVLHDATSGSDNGPSLDFRWHATNDRIDPYDAVNHAAGPEGQGAGFLGGVKFGF
jgi:hypothetical protein